MSKQCMSFVNLLHPLKIGGMIFMIFMIFMIYDQKFKQENIVLIFIN